MKRSIIIALALALARGTTAIAEVADTTENVEITAPVEETEAAPAEEEPALAEEESKEEVPSQATESESLNDALKALHEARQAAHTDELKAELDEYVAAGKLTQDQADLIYKYYVEQMTLLGNSGKGFGRGGKGGRNVCGIKGKASRKISRKTRKGNCRAYKKDSCRFG